MNARRAVAVAAVLVVSACNSLKDGPSQVCTMDGGAAANVPLTIEVGFGLSGCAPTNGKCTTTVDGGVVDITASVNVCATGTNPGGVPAVVTCSVAPLSPGTYELAPVGRSLVVVADGGAASCQL